MVTEVRRESLLYMRLNSIDKVLCTICKIPRQVEQIRYLMFTRIVRSEMCLCELGPVYPFIHMIAKDDGKQCMPRRPILLSEVLVLRYDHLVQEIMSSLYGKA